MLRKLRIVVLDQVDRKQTAVRRKMICIAIVWNSNSSTKGDVEALIVDITDRNCLKCTCELRVVGQLDFDVFRRCG
jgi:hypothetical protein